MSEQQAHEQQAHQQSGQGHRVRHDEPGSRWVVDAGGGEAGYAAYEREDGALRFTHTVVDPAHEGRGIGSVLVTAAVAHAREQGLQVLPQCSFVRAWLVRHPEHLDLVPAGQRGAYGLPEA